jgi:hypothetical protein
MAFEVEKLIYVKFDLMARLLQTLQPNGSIVTTFSAELVLKIKQPIYEKIQGLSGLE